MSLYDKLADAYSKPSKNYQALEEALGGVPKVVDALEGYKDRKDKDRLRKLKSGTIRDALGGRGIEGLPDYVAEAPLESLDTISKVAPFMRKQGEPGSISDLDKQNRMDARQQRAQDAAAKRQKERLDFMRGVAPTLKGNKEAVNQAKNAVQGLEALDNMWSEIDSLNPIQKKLASNDIAGQAFPTINAFKKNVRRTAAFAEGGKSLTDNEKEIVVQSFEPSIFDDAQSRNVKKKIARDYYLGTIDYFDAANLLGPAGEKLKAVANSVNQRQGAIDSEIKSLTGDPEADEAIATVMDSDISEEEKAARVQGIKSAAMSGR